MQARPDRNRLRHSFAAVIATVAVLAAACGDDGGSSSGELGSEAFGLTEEEFGERIASVESAIADCMSEAGFEYVPVDEDTIASVELWLRTAPGVSRRDYKTQFGFAATTRFDDPAVEVGKGEQNIRIFEDLSEADQIAYERTLWGDDGDATFAIGLDDEDFADTGGCTRSAVEEFFTAEQVSGEFVNPKDIQLDEDPRMVEAQENWRNCMLAEGYDYLEQDDIIDEFEERLDALLEEAEPEELSPEKSEALAALQREEIAVALVDLDCQIEFVDDIEEEVEREIFGFSVDD